MITTRVRRSAALLAAATAAVAGSALGPAPAHAAPAAPTGPTARTSPAGAADAAATIPLPTADAFYTYSGKTPLADVKPGTILLNADGTPAEREVDLAVDKNAVLPSGLALPAVTTLTAEQVLYRTSDELGRPSATVTTIVVPAAARANPTITAYLSFYDSLAAKCDPSYTLRGGDPNVGSSGTPNTSLTDVEQVLVQLYAADSVVTVPDFEGTHLDWTAGHEAGYGTLDAVRATEQYLRSMTVPIDATAATPVGLTGYSGGSIAADWASELAPTYAPDLNIVGVAEGGIPVDFAHNLDYIEGTSDWAPVIPATIATLSRSYGVDLSSYLSPTGLAAVAAARSGCIGDFADFGSGATKDTIQALLKPQYQDPYAIKAFVGIINQLIMGTEPGHPKGPLYMVVGNDPGRKQGQGDDIMLSDDDRALAHEYCEQGVPVQFTEVMNAPHTEAAIPFETGAIAFLQQRFAGTPFEAESCGSIGVGNSLAPVALHVTKPVATATSPITPARTTARAASGDLAFTGTNPEIPVSAGVLVIVGAGALVLRQRVARRTKQP